MTFADQELISRARAELQRGNLKAAESTCALILSSNPDDPEALNLRAMIAHQTTDFALAVTYYGKAIAARPEAAGYHSNLGVSLHALGRFDEAADAYSHAAALNPNSAQIQSNLGITLQALGRTESALIAHRRAIALRPDFSEAHNSLALSLYAAGDFEESIAEFAKAAALRPDFASAWSNMGNVLRDVGRVDEAASAYRRAISVQVDHPDARKNLALVLLLLGNYTDGFLEYEWRWKCADAQPGQFARPRWTGEDPVGKTILVYEEQGNGDVIQFARYASVLARRGARIIFGCRPQLARLMSYCTGVAQVITRGERIPAFDLHCPLLSLPLFCQTTSLASVPAEVPYIRLPEPILQPWKSRLAPISRPRVGLCWAGNPENRNDRFRSIPLERFASLAAVGNFEFHSLQVGPAAAERARVPALAIRDHEHDLADFADTAALISQLDLVISVDTAVAHLAGALGKPVWVLIPSAPDWRWLLERTDTPWYPTARLFRHRGSWEQVLSEVAAQLKEWSLK